jgi:ABC-type transporter Mla subunit MlaD
MASRAMRDLRRISDTVASIAELADGVRRQLGPIAKTIEHAVSTLDAMKEELAALRAGFEPMSNDLDSLRGAFAATTEELGKLRTSVAPELTGVRAAAKGLHVEVERQRAAIDRVDSTLGDLGKDLESRMTSLIETLSPMVRDLDEVRDVVEPLQTATERVGRIAERIPGSGRKRQND